MGIQGKYFKRGLPVVESVDTRGDEWRARHPETAVLQ
jgi:hypothetical protein